MRFDWTPVFSVRVPGQRGDGGLCGLAPVLQTGRIPLIASLKERSGNATGGGMRVRKALVIGQMAFTLILLIGAGLFVQTLARLHERVGFASGNLVMLSINPPSIGYSVEDAERAMRDVFRRLQELPVSNAWPSRTPSC